ncbi:MAG TPA: hypothetical protein VF742_15655 [Terracidiphilus sp.]
MAIYQKGKFWWCRFHFARGADMASIAETDSLFEIDTELDLLLEKIE